MLYNLYKAIRIITVIIVISIIIFVLSKFLPQLYLFFDRIFQAVKKFFTSGIQFITDFIR